MTPDPLQAALAHHRAGRHDEAARAYESILQAEPHHADALHLLGVLAHQRGEDAAAVELIQKAIAIRPGAAYHCNLAEAKRGLGEFAAAEAACRTAIALQPHYPEAWLNLSVALFQQRRFNEAEAASREALKQRPDFAAATVALADALREQWRIAEALEAYRRALALNPDLWAAHANYGLLCVQRGELAEGLEHCRKAVALEPNAALPRHNLGRLMLEYGSIDEAMDALAEAQVLAPDSAPLAATIGMAWLELGDFIQARNWFEKALELGPEMPEARCLMGDLRLEVGDPAAAITTFEEVLAKEPGRIEAMAGLARARLDRGDVAGAVASYEEALRLRPEAAGLHAALGHTLSTAGDLVKAVERLRKAIALNPNCVPAHAHLLMTLRDKATAEEVQQVERLLHQPWMTESRRAALHFGLAQVNDGRGEWASAAENMVQANALQKAYWSERNKGYDPAEHSLFIDKLIAAFTPEFFERLRGHGSASERPAFIVGLPRSGTTLTEQILASHPAVFGAGERSFAFDAFNQLPRIVNEASEPIDCVASLDAGSLKLLSDWHLERLRELDGGHERVVDKMPDNYQMLGFLVALFPQARFIHCRRDVRDVALSCWITNFAQIRWSVDLEFIAARIRDYQRLMTHWRRVLPVPLLEVDYEETVADQEGVSRRLVDWLGLAWDPRCLSFHATERLVRTASVAQVRQPIYRRSLARWKHYERMLEPLLKLLETAETNA